MVQIDVPGKPRRSRGVLGSIFGLKPRKTGPKIYSLTAFRYPASRSGVAGLFAAVGGAMGGSPPEGTSCCCRPMTRAAAEFIATADRSGAASVAAPGRRV